MRRSQSRESESGVGALFADRESESESGVGKFFLRSRESESGVGKFKESGVGVGSRKI